MALETPVGTLSADYRHDVTDTFNGSDITLRYSVDFNLGALTVTPALHANFIDRQTANHIYGVSNRQSEKFIKAGLPIAPYTISRAATNLGGDITATVILTDRLLLIGNMSGAYLGRSIRENPGLEDEFEAQALIGIGYAF
nr:MipA/OmpV family protein [Altererythrobacter sp. KTW20L]